MGNPRGPANALARDWRLVLQQTPSETADIAAWLSDTPERPELEGADDLVRPVTAQEVMDAMSHLKPGRACGPDRLANEFYRDHAEFLVPHLGGCSRPS